MFVRSPPSPADEAPLGASDPTAAVNNNDNIDGVALAANTPPRDHVPDTVPNPFFTSRGLSPVCMDPERVSLYRSFGFIVGLAVRTGVPLPLSNLSSQWWMLVSNDECPSAVTENAPGVTRMDADSPRTAFCSNATKEAPKKSPIDGVLSALRRLEEAGLKQEEMDEVLADARFVAPLSCGNSTDLVRGGENWRQGLVDLFPLFMNDTAAHYLSNRPNFSQRCHKDDFTSVSAHVADLFAYPWQVAVNEAPRCPLVFFVVCSHFFLS